MGVFGLLHGRLRGVMGRYGYVEPTPVQERAIPAVLEGRNVLIIAPTGTGKTEAALFPIFSRLLEDGLDNCIYVLYITPLRSLNRDIFRRMANIAGDLGIRLEVRHSDTPAGVKRRQTQVAPHVLVTTPETLQVVLLLRRLRDALRCTRFVVIDEVHELVTSKRGAQLALGLERLSLLSPTHQRIGLSATVEDPERAAGFLAGTGRPVKVIDVSLDKEYLVDVEYVEPTEADGELAARIGVPVDTAARLRRIVGLAETHRNVLLFANTRDTAEFLGSKLKALMGEAVAVHHGSLSRDERTHVEELLKSGKVRLVVSTSSLELGIDIGHIDLVIQYGSPRQVSRLLQRVGRSGHRLDAPSRGVVMALSPEDRLESMSIVDAALGRNISGEMEYHENALDVLVHQLVGLALDARLDGRHITVEEAHAVISRAHPYRDITLDDVRAAVEYSARHRLLLVDGERLAPRRGSIRYYFENVSVIPDQKKYRAVDDASGRVVGELDEEFVYSINPGDRIILGGRTWVVSRVGESSVLLYPDTDVVGALPSWIGEEIPVPYSIAQDVCRRRGEELEATGALDPSLIPGPDRALISRHDKYAVVHACLGSKGNEALGMYLSHHLSSVLGPVGYRADPYRVLLLFRDRPRPDILLDAFRRDDNYIVRTVTNAVRSSKLFRYRFLQVARRMGLVRRDVSDVPQRLVDVYMDDLPGMETMREIIVEKIDLARLLEFVSSVREGRTMLVDRYFQSPLPIDEPILFEGVGYDFAVERGSQAMLRELVKRRVLSREVNLMCLSCGAIMTLKATYMPDRPSCPNCGSGALAVLKGIDGDGAKALLAKFRRRMRMTKEEQRLMDGLRLSATVTLQYGRLGVLAQLAHGVGPHTAMRVLSSSSNEDELWANILEAERQYARTRAFWD